ncbi:SMP-30/gluconolactonase/LRE family protein [Oceanicoccus sp. KOV_DT_Chl]|uniref:SMP-30/gluconolactonase/LRE family protein n=1 Tax=Oceanicoccus sp. KOV_DT_Chl TaxID=1904639 RepID=UPI000C7B1D8E|nr:SMP-30/gluconolactonase/LRE family protein [Oceanicoccus sp. KOV_DT_Chl]
MKKILLSLVILVAGFSIWSYWSMDGFKSIEPHFAGSCRTVTGEGSAEDIDIDRQAGVMFISAKDRLGAASGAENNGTISVYDLGKAAKQFDMLPISSLDDFSPHGISLYQSPEGLRRLFVINHRHSGEESIELFDVAADHSLAHVKTIKHELLFSPNDLVAVGMEQFYVANDSGATTGFEKGMEMMGLMSLAKIVYFDGESAKPVLENFPTSGGINRSADGHTLYIGGTSSKTLEVYRRDMATGALTFMQSIPLAMGVDNIDVAADGSVWVAGHPKVIDLISHFTSNGDKPAPSQIYLLPVDTVAADGRLAEPVDLFTSLGDDLSASSVAAEFAGQFYVGGITPKKFLICQPGV